MSTAVSPPPSAKKPRKHKDGTEKKSKKRQREEEEQTEEPLTAKTAPDKKKHKKRKLEAEQQEPAKSAPAPALESTEPTPAKKPKKRKTEQAVDKFVATGLADEIEQVNGAEKKHKKSKKDQGVAEEVGAIDRLTQPVVEPDTVKKSKKKMTSTAPDDTPPVQEDSLSHAQESSFSLQSKKPLKRTKEASNFQAQPPALPQLSTSQIFPESQQSNASQAAKFDDSLLKSYSPFAQQTMSFYLSLSPVAHNFPLEGLCAEHISPLLLTYFPPLRGIVLSYANPRLSEHPEQGAQVASSKEAKTVLSRSIDEYAVTYVWLTAEFTLFRPEKGTLLEGYVNLQNEGVLGLVCYNYFNAGIERSRLPSEWRWTGDERSGRNGRRDHEEEASGYYVDGQGEKVEGRLLFRVRDFEASAGAETGVGSINIYGTLLAQGDDLKLDDEDKQQGLVQANGSKRRMGS